MDKTCDDRTKQKISIFFFLFTSFWQTLRRTTSASGGFFDYMWEMDKIKKYLYSVDKLTQ